MAVLPELPQADMDKLHAALTSAGLGQGQPNVTRVSAELAKQGVDAQALGIRIFCHPGHYCIIIRDITKMSNR